LAYDLENWIAPVRFSRLNRCFGGRRQVGKDHAQNKELERDDDSKKSHHALTATEQAIRPSFERIHHFAEHRTEDARCHGSQEKAAEFEVYREIDLGPIVAIGIEPPDRS